MCASVESVLPETVAFARCEFFHEASGLSGNCTAFAAATSVTMDDLQAPETIEQCGVEPFLDFQLRLFPRLVIMSHIDFIELLAQRVMKISVALGTSQLRRIYGNPAVRVGAIDSWYGVCDVM